jgi:hypothetical protein
MSYTKKSTKGSQDSPMYSPLGVKTPCVFTTGELRLSGVFITKESFWTPRSRITDFKEHTTIFRGSLILKIDCRLLMFEKLANLGILIDSPVYSLPGNRLWIQITLWIFLRSEIVSGQNTSGRQDYPMMNTLGSLDSWTVFHQKVFLQTCSGACSKYTKKSTHWCIHHREVEIPQCIHYRGAETPQCIQYWGVETP